MNPFPVLDQLQVLNKQIEDIFIERNFYRETALIYVSQDLLEQQVQRALQDPDNRQAAHALFEPAYTSLQNLVQHFVAKELSKHSQPTDQSN